MAQLGAHGVHSMAQRSTGMLHKEELSTTPLVLFPLTLSQHQNVYKSQADF